MAAYIRPLGSVFGHFNGVTEDFIVNNGATVTNGDFLSFNGSGVVIPTTTGRIIGTAQSTVVGDGTKTVKVLIAPYTKYLVAASTALAATDVGKYFNLTGATGAQKVDQSTGSATLGQLLVLQINPKIDPVRTDTTWNIVTVAQYSLDGVTQN